MKTQKIIRLGIAATALALGACGKQPGPADAAADLLFFGGPIYTGVETAPAVEAVAVREGKILAAGALADLQKNADDKTQRIDLKGAALFPGFVDSHAHLLGIGLRELTLNLEGVASVDELTD
ncbi:MAG: amidohydrolase family protein, partial [Methylocella sp.]